MRKLMQRSVRVIVAAGLTAAWAGCGMDEEGASAAGHPEILAQVAGSGCLAPSRDDFASPGPYGVKTKAVTIGRLGAYTIFYPERFEEGCAHPIVAWGNGTGVNGPAAYEHWQRHMASWGLVAIASHSPNVALDGFLAGGIAYLLKENATAGSEFAGKLSDRAGMIGHSQGGLEAVLASGTPNVKAVVNVQGAGKPAAGVPMLCLTGTEDFARPLCTDSYNTASGPAFLADLEGASHVGTPSAQGAATPNGKLFVQLGTAWSRCFLGADDAACQVFRGGSQAPACKLGTYATCNGKNIP